MKIFNIISLLLLVSFLSFCSYKIFIFSNPPENIFPKERILAFPGAEGFGRYAEGARGVDKPEIYIVTSLNDSGPGSFRDAVSQEGRFVVFSVGGILRLKSPVTIAPNTTIAGQTAPGDGIVFYGQKVSFTGANNSIARNLRIRLGTSNEGSKNTDASGISNGKNIILDHMSVSWGLDEVFSINWNEEGHEPDSITIQNSIISQGLHRYNHSAGGLMQTENGNISMIKNLYISNKTRNPKVKGNNEFINNIIYNYGNVNNQRGHSVSGAGYIMGGSAMTSHANIINNYFIGGPLTPKDEKTPFSRGTPTFFLYSAGNYFDNNKNGILDGELISTDPKGYPGIPVSNFKDSPYPYREDNTHYSAKEAYNFVKQNVGASYPSRDMVDQLLIDELSSLGAEGMYVYAETDLPLNNNGLGVYESGIEQKDTDKDGIPDKWEKNNDLDPKVKEDALKKSTIAPGYYNIEVYINSLVNSSHH